MLELENPDVWSDPERAQQLGKEKAALEAVVDGLANAMQALDDAAELLELSPRALRYKIRDYELE